MATGGEAQGRFEAVVLAAGAGARFGGRKLLAQFRGASVLEGALAAAFAAPAAEVVLVTGAEAEDVAAAARRFAERAGQAKPLRIVHAADHAEGMAASLRAGIAALPTETAGAFVFLGDMPRVPHSLTQDLAAAVEGGAPAAAPVFAGRRGNPVLLSRELFPQLLALAGDEGARRVLQGLGERLALVPAADDGVLFDVDRPQDLKA